MHLTLDRAVLLKALGHVQSVVERRGTVPVLSHVKLEAKGDTLTLTGTDMDISISEKLNAKVESAGSTTIPAHTFYDIIRKLPDGSDITIIAKDAGKVAITAGSSKFHLGTLPVDEFPVMSDVDFTHHFTLVSAECKALLEKPAYAMSTEETRYYLNGIYVHVIESGGGEVLRAVATDGHRLARVEVSLPAGASGMPGVIVPRKTIYELRKLMEDGASKVDISLSATKIKCVVGNAIVVSKLIDGSFPDYERVIPANNTKMLEVDCGKFTQAVDRVAVISSERTRAVKLSLSQGKLTVSATSAEQGSASEELEVTYAADSFEIGFNSRYLLEMMTQIEGENGQFLLQDGASPVLVRDTADVSALYVIMPMRV